MAFVDVLYAVFERGFRRDIDDFMLAQRTYIVAAKGSDGGFVDRKID